MNWKKSFIPAAAVDDQNAIRYNGGAMKEHHYSVANFVLYIVVFVFGLFIVVHLATPTTYTAYTGWTPDTKDTPGPAPNSVRELDESRQPGR